MGCSASDIRENAEKSDMKTQEAVSLAKLHLSKNNSKFYSKFYSVYDIMPVAKVIDGKERWGILPNIVKIAK